MNSQRHQSGQASLAGRCADGLVTGFAMLAPLWTESRWPNYRKAGGARPCVLSRENIDPGVEIGSWGWQKYPPILA